MRKVEQALRRAALWNEVKDRLHHSALSLSGGQQQRLCVARALVVEPQVCCFEPASHGRRITSRSTGGTCTDRTHNLHRPRGSPITPPSCTGQQVGVVDYSAAPSADEATACHRAVRGTVGQPAVLAPVVLVFVASTDASGPAAAALADAVAEALGAGARVVLQSYAGAPPGDEQLEAAARAQGAAAAARLVWDRPGGNRAALDLYLAEKDMTVHRGLDFEPQDQPVERGRAIGLVLASLLLGNRPRRRPPPLNARPSARPRRSSPGK